MPKSKHRKKPYRQHKEEMRRSDLLDSQAKARREIYERALPEHQEYPPLLLKDIHKRKPKPVEYQGSRAARFYPSADLKPNMKFQTSDKRIYQVQDDGSLRVLNKPRSRVKRLKERAHDQKLAA